MDFLNGLKTLCHKIESKGLIVIDQLPNLKFISPLSKVQIKISTDKSSRSTPEFLTK